MALQLDTHKPMLLQAIIPFVGAAAQGTHDVPHVCKDVLETHWPEQT